MYKATFFEKVLVMRNIFIVHTKKGTVLFVYKKRVATNLTTLPIGDTPIPINGTRPLFCVQR